MLGEQHQAHAAELSQGLLQRLVQDGLLLCPAVAVELVQLAGQGHGRVHVRGQEHVQGRGRVVQPSGRVDARGQAEGDVARAQLGEAVEPGGFLERGDAGPGRLLDEQQPVLDQDAVDPDQGHHVGHRAQGGQVQELADVQGVAGQEPVQGRHQEKSHAHPGQIGAGAVPAVKLGVGHGVGPGQFVAGQVMVRDHHGQAQLLGPGHGLQVRDAAVHGHQHSGPLAGQFLHALHVEAVALLAAPGQMAQGRDAALCAKKSSIRAEAVTPSTS